MVEALKIFLSANLADSLPLALNRIYTDDELGKSGLIKTNPVCAGSWESFNGLVRLMPSLVIREIIRVGTTRRRNMPTKARSFNAFCAVTFYGETTWDDLKISSEAVYDLLGDSVIIGAGYCFFQNQEKVYVVDMNNALCLRDTYMVKGIING